uniref:RNA-dependent RNA polymerase n=1 Tax=Lentinula edodes bipartite virus 1 TaxID=2491350 RepID=A0A9E7V862_9VIRU|nr:RNA-dependent RNA polymerase [Lentinula edodes bipartite virus 1]
MSKRSYSDASIDPEGGGSINAWAKVVRDAAKPFGTGSSDFSFRGASDTTGGSQASSPSRRFNKRARHWEREHLARWESELVQRLDKLKYLGKVEPYAGMDKDIQMALPCEEFSKFVTENPGLFEDVKIDEWCFVEANSVVELNHLERFNRDYTELSDEYRPFVEAAAEMVADLLVPDEPMPFPTVDDLEEVRFERRKFAGLEYARLGMRTRGEAHEIALGDARVAWEELMAGKEIKPHSNRMGGRGKLVRKEKVEAQGKKTTAGRLILMSSQRDLLLTGITEQRITNSCRHPSVPISVGKTWWKGGVREFLDRFGKYKLFSCFDAEKFDAGLPPWLIRLAVIIMRHFFINGMDPKYDAYWEFVYESLIYAEIYLDNGMVFQRNGGSTSGHCHNSLMQSICTLIMVHTSYLKLIGLDRRDEVAAMIHSESLGDDQITGAMEEAADYGIEDIAPITEECFGISWWGDKSFNTERLVDSVEGAFEGIQYLGKYFYWFDDEVEGVHVQANLPYRPFIETVLKLYYPERGEQGVNAAWSRAVGHYADAAGLQRTRVVLDQYMDWLEPRTLTTEFTWTARQIRRLGNHIDTAPPPIPARRISFAEWLQAVLTNVDVE